jgi:hypothetical protein
MTSATTGTGGAIEIHDVWAAVRRLGLYRRADMELEAVIACHRGGPLLVDRVTVAAARLVRDLRQRSAAGYFL